MRRQRSWLYAAVPVTAAFFSLLFALNAAWIPLKGELAQWLIHRSWQLASQGHPPPPPWPWADTTTAAMLSAPAHDVRLYVLRGNSGRNLAFGPVLSDTPGGGMDRVISGHRDTHFRFLEDLRMGDLLHLTDRRGGSWFRVQDMDVIDSRTTQLVVEHGVERLSLVTCYPFDKPSAGGPLRYVVTAYAVDAAPRLGEG